ncbi:hypothetical protein PLCT1_02485 [Planctomycetaceae bacterium]|nr:hypothetical protein PLCT1_02485 [Planctomycetaceae bacterium]
MLSRVHVAFLGVALLIISMSAIPAEAKIDRAQQAQKWANCEKLLKDPKCDIDSQVDAVKTLTGLMDYDVAVKLLAYWAACDKSGEVERDAKGNPKKPDKDARPKGSHKIAMEILKQVRGITEPEEALKFSKDVTDKAKWPLRVRATLYDTIAVNASSNAECMAFVMKTAKECPDIDIRVLSISSLTSNSGAEGVFDLACGVLNDRSWRIRDVAIELILACASVDKDRAILALINRLALEQGKLKLTLSKALTSLTNETLGTDSNAWVDWWKTKKRAEAGLPPKVEDGGKGTAVKRIFDTETFSDRYIFVIDASDSMTRPISPEELEKLRKAVTGEKKDDKRKELDWSKIKCKLDLAREELIRSLEILDPKVARFTIISFKDDIAVWSDELRPTEPKIVAEAAEWLRGLKGKNKTNISGAMDAAFDMCDRLSGVDPAKVGKKEKGVITGPHPDDYVPDTIFLYSDGYATSGKYGASTDELKAMGKGKDVPTVYRALMTDYLAYVRDRNRISRLSIHTVGTGLQDEWFLGNLAKQNDGSYVALAREKH